MSALGYDTDMALRDTLRALTNYLNRKANSPAPATYNIYVTTSGEHTAEDIHDAIKSAIAGQGSA